MLVLKKKQIEFILEGSKRATLEKAMQRVVHDFEANIRMRGMENRLAIASWDRGNTANTSYHLTIPLPTSTEDVHTYLFRFYETMASAKILPD